MVALSTIDPAGSTPVASDNVVGVTATGLDVLFSLYQIAGSLSGLITSFTSSQSGFAPASGGGTANFLRADGTWAVPAGGGGGAAGVASFNSRTGIVLPQNGDYSFAQLSGSINAFQLPLFTSSTTGAVSASGGGTANFLRADGTWAPAAGGGAGGATGQIQWNNVGTLAGFTVSGDGTLVTSTGALTVTKTNGVAFAPSATTDTTNAGNLGSGTLPAARLPNPSAAALGGIRSAAPVTNQWINSISTSGIPALSRPTFSDISGNIATGQMNSGTAATVSTFFRGDGTWATPQAPVIPGGLPSAGGNLTFYVATTGSDSAAGTVGAPFATIQHALNVAASFDYGGLYLPTINIGAGTFNITTPLALPTLVNKNTSLGTSANLAGASATTTIIHDTSGGGVIMCIGAGNFWNITALKVDGPLFGLYAAYGGIIATNFAGGSMAFTDSTGTSTEFFQSVNGGTLSVGGTTTIGTSTFAELYYGGGQDAVFSIGGSLILPASGVITPGSILINTRTSGSTFVGWDATVTNPGTFTGTQLFFGGGSPTNLTTTDGTLASLPGISTGNLIDATSTIGAAFSNQQNFFEPIAGPPKGGTSGTIVNGQSWTVNKDTVNGPRTLTVNDAGIVHVRQIGRNINKQVGTGYTMALFDQDGRVEMNNASANTFTVPQDSAFTVGAPPVGTEVRVTQTGAGATTIAAGAGATVNAAGVVGGQWKSMLLYKTAANTWVQTSV